MKNQCQTVEDKVAVVVVVVAEVVSEWAQRATVSARTVAIRNHTVGPIPAI